MDSKQIINYRQFAWLTASLLTGGGLVSIQHDLVRVARMDAWFTYIIPSIYGIAIGFMFYKLSQRFPGKNLFDITKITLGKGFGTLCNLLLIFHLWLLLIRDVRSFTKFMGTILLPNTPEEIALMMLILLIMYFGRTSIEVIARVNDIFFPFFALTIIFLPLMLSNELDKSLVEPVLAGDMISVWYGNLLTLGWYGDVLIMGAFLHTLGQLRLVRSAIRHGVILSSLFLGIFLLMEVLVFGPVITDNLIYPNYNLVQQIHITDFLDRMDLLILSIWAPILFCKDILIYMALLTGIASLVKQRDYSTINTPVGLFVLMTSLLAFKNTTEVFSFGNYSSTVIVLCYQPLLLILLVLFARRFPKLQQAAGEQQKAGPANGGADPPEGGQSKGKAAEDSGGSGAANQTKHSSGGSGSRGSQRSYHGWSRTSNLLLLIGLIAVGTGLWGSEYHSMIGVGCSFVYGACMILAVISSYMELVQARQQ
ncbi:Spore germination protein YndE [Paenibacillus konkukensis]|uniref:Spore germination protein YndE n=1 Tax=Paenibacillus konkukensis TaxID=2020716 RepID=A0ABY4RRW8_9BACL|nr:endospore germination permease [Paenibacillus konkukensis]UQZ85212.1 Spore germination protein YndE [Paenibacillus konkukensis]